MLPSAGTSNGMSGEERRVIGLSPEDAAISTDEQVRVLPHEEIGNSQSHTWPIQPIFYRCRVFLYEVLERAFSALVHVVSAVGGCRRAKKSE